MKMKILHVIHSMELAGAERVVEQLVQGLSTKEIFSDICCLSNKGVLGKKLEGYGFKVSELNKTDGVKFEIFFRLFLMMKKEKYALVHFHNKGSLFYGLPALLLLGIPSIVTLHGDFNRNHSNYGFESFCFSKVNKIITVSKAIHDDMNLKFNASNKISTIYNGVEINQPSNMSNDCFQWPFEVEGKIILGAVGNLTRVKNHIELLKSFKILEEKNQKKFILVVLGEGPERQNLESYLKLNHLDDRVYLLGRVEKPEQYVQKFDIFLQPSLSEGISIALLEAMSLERPVIVTNVGGNAEIIQNALNGILVSLNNSNFPNRFASAISDLANDQQERFFLGKNARQTVILKFDSRRMIDQYETLYRQLVG